jgi:hypothetical protein
MDTSEVTTHIGKYGSNGLRKAVLTETNVRMDAGNREARS